jgi:superfamily II DNA or RNA helicase
MEGDVHISFVPKEADRAYVSNGLWLPKSKIRVGPVRRALEFIVASETGQILMRLWDESSNHVICPREFLPASEYPRYDFPFVDLRPEFQKVEFVDKVVPRNEEQERAWAALARNDNGILNLACGKGKTVLAVKKIAQRKTPTLVIVPDSGILEQWQQAVGKFLEFDGELGLVQGPVFKWAHPVTLALVTTLWKRIEDGNIPEEMFRYFGQVIYDEVHRIGAPKFSTTATPFYGDRIGLTATAQREDGLDPIYRYHIGEVFYSDLAQQLIPDIVFQQTAARIPYEDALVNGVTNVSILRTLLAKDLAANTARYWGIQRALMQGRKVLALSHSKAQLRLFHAMFPGSGLIIQETKNRTSVLRDNQLVFAIAKLGSEGVDDDRLDTLVCLTPFRSKNALQQSMGRIQRPREGKKKPLMVIFEDWMNPPLKNLCKALRTELRKWKYPFSNVKPVPLMPPLPSDVSERYEQMATTLREKEEADGD